MIKAIISKDDGLPDGFVSMETGSGTSVQQDPAVFPEAEARV
jgi:hypothetical protein